MERITPSQYIRLNKKICNSKMIITVHRLAGEKLISPQEVCYALLHEAILREYNKKENAKSH